jgi:hypothetical protein
LIFCGAYKDLKGLLSFIKKFSGEFNLVMRWHFGVLCSCVWILGHLEISLPDVLQEP